ncbi:MAG: hypothetical protein WC655_29835, partial [Candidatus Hydrogenedentales bacterium]|jgi:preprotein translocase subunit SecD
VSVEKLPDGKLGIVTPEKELRAQVKDLVMRRGTVGFFEVATEEETAAAIKTLEQNPEFHGRLTPLLSGPDRQESLPIAEDNYDRVAVVIAEIGKKPELLPKDMVLMVTPKEAYPGLYLVHKVSPMSSVTAVLAKATPPIAEPGGNATVILQLSDADGKKFGEFSQGLIGKPLAIVVDGALKSVPKVRSRITNSVQITGNFTPEEAENIAAALWSGSLPAPLAEVK